MDLPTSYANTRMCLGILIWLAAIAAAVSAVMSLSGGGWFAIGGVLISAASFLTAFVLLQAIRALLDLLDIQRRMLRAMGTDPAPRDAAAEP